MAKRNISDGVSNLEKSIKTFNSMELDSEEKNVMLYFSFTLTDLKEMLAAPYSLENGALIMDLSESLLEGAELIAQKRIHEGSGDVTMLVLVDRMKFLLERINKYYIAHYSGIKDDVNISQLQQAVAEFEINLEAVSAGVNKDASQKSRVNKINDFWPIAKQFYLGIEEGSLPVIVLASTSSLEKELRVLEESLRKEVLSK